MRKHERNVNARPDQGLQTKHQTTTGLKDSVRETPAISVKDAANLPLTNSSQTENKPKKVHKSQLLRLRVTEERIWIALTGHGVNHSRCPRMEFACLSVIASRRYDGIVQPELTRVTGQDKRSLPRRTDSLAKKGYIEKTLAFTRGQRTSHLILRRYANRKRPQQFSTTDGKGSNEGHQSSTGQRTWGGDFLRPSIAVRSLVAEVKNHSVITQADLKWKLVSINLALPSGTEPCLTVLHFRASQRRRGNSNSFKKFCANWSLLDVFNVYLLKQKSRAFCGIFHLLNSFVSLKITSGN